MESIRMWVLELRACLHVFKVAKDLVITISLLIWASSCPLLRSFPVTFTSFPNQIVTTGCTESDIDHNRLRHYTRG